MTNGHRDYKKQYQHYDSKPKNIHKRVEDNKARSMMEKQGRVHKGDGKDVDHIRPQSKGGSTEFRNLRVVTAHQNRSYRRNADSSWKGTK